MAPTQDAYLVFDTQAQKVALRCDVCDAQATTSLSSPHDAGKYRMALHAVVGMFHKATPRCPHALASLEAGALEIVCIPETAQPPEPPDQGVLREMAKAARR